MARAQFAKLTKRREPIGDGPFMKALYTCSRCGHVHHTEVGHCLECNSKIIQVFEPESREDRFRRQLTEGGK